MPLTSSNVISPFVQTLENHKHTLRQQQDEKELALEKIRPCHTRVTSLALDSVSALFRGKFKAVTL